MELGGVKGGETVVGMDCIREEPTFNKKRERKKWIVQIGPTCYIE